MTRPMLVASNFTGHPCLHLRAGFIESGTRGLASLGSGKLTTGEADEAGQMFRVPQGISLWGRLFQEEADPQSRNGAGEGAQRRGRTPVPGGKEKGGGGGGGGGGGRERESRGN